MPFDFKDLDGKLAAAKDWLSKEFRNFRTGRSNPAILGRGKRDRVRFTYTA